MKPLPLLALLSLLAAGSALSVQVNEFLADNTATSLRDEDGETPDWIELHNPSASTVSLEGFFLTDDRGDLTKWAFPGISIPPGGYLVIFASGKDRAPLGGELHTNFVLDQAGEYLALVDGNGTTVLSEFGEGGADYPNQRPGVSYGASRITGEPRHFLNPTPGAANDEASAVQGFVADTRFDIDRGFYTDPFSVTITTRTPGATIRFTTDGSWPSERTGRVYTGPVLIDRTLPLKAIAFKEGHVSSNVDTQTYIFVDDVVQQTPANTQSTWRLPPSWNGQTPYYGMNGNPSVNPLAHPSLKEDLQLVPTLSISMETDDLFGSSGIYSNPQASGESWERWTSLEFIDPAQPDGSNNFQQNCAIRIQGGAFRSFGLTRKKSFRVLFKSEYGTANLPTGGPGKLDFPLFGPDAATEFQTLVFRMESNDGWQWNGAGAQPQYARDEFGRRAQLALGQPAPHGRHCHLYLNGVYWGVYNVVERPDSGFAESYFGATRDTWQGQNSGSPINSTGSLADWNSMLGALDDISAMSSDPLRDREYLEACGYRPDGSRSPRVPVWIDPVNFADYLLVNWYGGNSDWPHKNYYCGRSRDEDSEGFKFFMWDSEWSLFLRSDLGTNRTSNFDGVAAPQRHLERSPEYRLLFGDRAHRALFNDGVFTPLQANALYQGITEQHRRILNAEAARWGNQHGGQYNTRDWLTERRRLGQWFSQRGNVLLNQLRSRGLYPDLDAPTFSPHGGSVPAGVGPRLSVPDDITKVYYRFGPGDDDTADYGHPLDPRLVGGMVHPEAVLIDFGAAGNGSGVHTSDPLPLTEPGFLFARAYDSGTRTWSALNTALFTMDTVPASADNLVVSEIHYHPAAPTAAEIAAGFLDQDQFEFLGIRNIGSTNVDLSGVDFLNGVDYAFSPGFTLGAGAEAVVVRDLAAFLFRYPAVPGDRIAGEFRNGSGLRNSGELLVIRAADGSLIKSFEYDDEEPWPTLADGLSGASLVLVNPVANPDHGVAANWRLSSSSGGNPGASDALRFAGDPEADLDRDGLPAVVEHAVGTSDTTTGDQDVLVFGSASFEVGGENRSYFTLRFPRDLRAEDVEVIPQVSTDLIDWEGGPIEMLPVGRSPLGGARVLEEYRCSVPASEAGDVFVRLLVRLR